MKLKVFIFLAFTILSIALVSYLYITIYIEYPLFTILFNLMVFYTIFIIGIDLLENKL
jgi:hypothetical protein